MKPAREQAKGDVELLCDLDAIIEKTSTFKLHGKIHEIEPITTETFYKFVNGVLELQRAEVGSSQEDNARYLALVQPLCKSITRKDVDQMTMVQKGALLQKLSQKITGQSVADDDSKKKH